MKGFVFTDDSEIALRFLISGAFDALADQHDITFVVAHSATGADGLLEFLQKKNRHIIEIPYWSERLRRFKDIFDISCIMNENLSPSFAERTKIFRRDAPLRFARLRKIAKSEVYVEYRRRIEEHMGLHPDILTATVRERPDFFVLTSALLDYQTDDVLLISERLAIPTLMLIAGWDNLSSKGLLFRQPSRMAVWGEQSRQHAIEIQKTPPSCIFVIGAPHFETILTKKNEDRLAIRRDLKVPEDVPLVLFAGTLRMFDETALLEELDATIESGILPRIHVLYRPHPWRERRKQEANFFDRTWKHITMDPEMIDSYRGVRTYGPRQLPKNFLQRTAHLARLYHASDVVLSPMSTVLLEALVCGLPTMAVTFGDGKHVFSIDQVSKMLHFKELYDIPEVVVCRNRDKFFADVKRTLQGIGDIRLRASLKKSSCFFVHQDERSYGERVGSEVNAMLVGQFRPNYAVTIRGGRRFRLQGFWRQSFLARLIRKLTHKIERGVAACIQ